MKILNIEDNSSKHWQIRSVLDECGITELEWKTNLADGMDEILKSIKANHPYDLIITDMNFPESPMKRRGEVLSGELLIEKLKKLHITIPVILCSSVNYKYPELYGNVHFSDRVNWENELKKLVRQLK